MNTVGELKQLRVPIQVENIEEVEYTLVVYPEDAVVVLRRAVRVVVELGAESQRPVPGVQFGVVPSPAEMRPGVLQL